MMSISKLPNLHRFDADFKAAAAINGLDYYWLKAQAIAESNLDPKAVSPVGAKGIAQFMPATWSEWGRGGDPFDPVAAISAQGRYMAWLVRFLKNTSPDYRAVLAAYNWGIGRVTKNIKFYKGQMRLEVMPIETQQYVKRITEIQAELREIEPA
jgi:soluble lytic murein transglycosylase-like protein